MYMHMYVHMCYIYKCGAYVLTYMNYMHIFYIMRSYNSCTHTYVYNYSYMYIYICVCLEYVCDLRPVRRYMWLCLHDLFAFVESTCVFVLLQPIATYNWLITL